MGGYITGPALRHRTSYRPKPTGSRGDFAWTDNGPAFVCADGEAIGIDAVIMAFHGLYGEDGREQAYLERLGIPYTGVVERRHCHAQRCDQGISGV